MIQPYDESHRSQIVDLIQMNIPKFFHPSEEADFILYLEQEIEDYFVYEMEGTIVGCGGLNYKTTTEGVISWDIIHPDYQGKGIGKELMMHRLEHLKSNDEIEKVTVRTSQLAYRFYEKFGFRLENIIKDGWAPGFDIYEMSMPL